jgi:glutamyl-tRNA synthetase
MHLGNARTFLAAWLAVRGAGGRLIMRIEDLDRPRVLPGAESALLSDLHWLGLDWDEGPDSAGPQAPYRQSERFGLYRDALENLRQENRAFPCACSRAELEGAASAPHDDADGPVYPGTCRDLSEDDVMARAQARGRKVAWRFRADTRPISFSDGVFGAQQRIVDDFVLMRADGVPSYQLAVTVDDLAMGITQVVRGADLLGSTARQLALMGVLKGQAPTYAHVPLVLAPEGIRLAKRNRPIALEDLRNQGMSANTLRLQLARSLGIVCDEYAEPAALVAQFSFNKLNTHPWTP